MSYNIAIDGPAGAGKSTIAKLAAEKLGFIYIDTGAMYRALAWYFIKNGLDEKDERSIEKACKDIKIRISYQDGEQQLYLNGENITPFIRSEKAGNAASVVSAYKSVRDTLLQLQRDLADKEDVIMDGRDIGTCVLPDADLKLYLTAAARTRAERRYHQLLEKGIEKNIAEIEEDIIERDKRDMNREIAPLKQAQDAVYLDTSDMDIHTVIEEILRIFHEKTGKDGKNGS